MTVLMALTETLAWLRLLDELLRQTWQKELPATVRDQASCRIDEGIRRRKEVPGFAKKAFEERKKNHRPYAEWTLVLLDLGLALSPEQFRALRWLAGKMLHFGPLPAIELRQSRAGAEPQWTWRRAEDIFPEGSEETKRPGQRKVYEEHLAGRTVLGTFNLTMMLIEMEHAFFALIRNAEKVLPPDTST
jgi:hypothetical protein